MIPREANDKKNTPVILTDSMVGFYHILPKPSLRAAQLNQPAVIREDSPPHRHIYFAKSASNTPFRPSVEYLAVGSLQIPSIVSFSPPTDLAKWKRENDKAIQDACAKALATCKAGKRADAKIPGRQVLLRPVVAKSQFCLSCHKANRVGDTLGVLLYIIPAK